MAKIQTDLRLKIEAAIEDKEYKTDLRSYLGISAIGDECARKLWYGFRWCKQERILARQQRLFSRGHREEPIVIADLREIGVAVHSMQIECTACGGHVKGHSDGFCDNLPDAPKTTHLLEIKTANDKNFKALVKHGLQKQFPVYYAQMSCYERLYKLSRGLFIAVNKNDDTRHYERVYANNQLADDLFNRAQFIITAIEPPDRIGSITWFKCKESWCKFSEICQSRGDILITCRTCQFAFLLDGGGWGCSEHEAELEISTQLCGCPQHEPLKALREHNFYIQD